MSSLVAAAIIVHAHEQGLGSGPRLRQDIFSPSSRWDLNFLSLGAVNPGPSFAQRSVRLVFLHFKQSAWFLPPPHTSHSPLLSLIHSSGYFDEVLSWHEAPFGGLFEDSVRR